MLTSLELRWFCPGPLPGEVQYWFQHDCPGQLLRSRDERVDQYLFAPECDYLSVKLRQGRLEVKWRQQQLAATTVSPNAQGCIEQWLKWICTDATGDSLLGMEQQLKGPWLAVDKARLQRKYRVYGQGSFTGVALDEPLDRGCAVELTRLRLLAQDWWTLGFEAFGSEALRLEDLRRLAQQVLQSYPGPSLDLSDSKGYPEWLSEPGMSPRD